MNEIMRVEQLPRLIEQFEAVGKEVDVRLEPLRKLVCTEDNFKNTKEIRAQMRKEFEEYEAQKKEIKAKVFGPWEAFERSYKANIADKYKQADAELKAEIDAVSDELKSRREEEVKSYFDEYAQSLGVDFIPFHRAGIHITLSASTKSLKSAAKAFLDKAADDMRMIMAHDAKEEILVEYKESLNASDAVARVMERHAKIKAEQEKPRETEECKPQTAPPLSAPVEQEPVLTVSFRVTAEKSKLQKLKQFLIDGGYQYE